MLGIRVSVDGDGPVRVKLFTLLPESSDDLLGLYTPWNCIIYVKVH